MEIIAKRVKKLTPKEINKKLLPANPQEKKPIDVHIYADKVEKKAYELYKKRGCQDGRDWQDWFQAEKLV